MSNRPTSFKKALKPTPAKKTYETNSLLKDIEALSKEKILQADDSDVKELREQIMDARRKLNPYNVEVKDCDQGSLIFSFINMQRDYMTKLLTTGMVAFLRRSANEWMVPPNIPVVDVVDYLNDPSLVDPIEPTDGRALPQEDLDAYETNKRMMLKRMVVVEFLEHMFGFDPDKHARPGYKPNYADPERRPILTPSAEMAVLLEKKRTEKSRRANVSEKKEAAELYERFQEEKRKALDGVELEKPCTREVIRTIKGRDGQPMKVKRVVKCTETEFKLAQLKRDNQDDPNNLKVLRTDSRVIPMGDPDYNDYFDRRNQARDQTLHDTVRDLIPPADFYYRFNVYLDKHYEQILDATRDLYHEKPDFDASVLPYKHFKEGKEDPETHEKLSIDEQVKRFRHAHARDINFGINEVRFVKWTMIAPYKQNRDRVEYFGANMAIFEEMFKMKAAERNLAKDMMDKSVERKRKDLEKIHGKRDPEFEKNYGVIGSENLSKYGVDKISEEEEDRVLDELDAIKVGIFRISQGGRKIDVDKLYTKSEAPEFMLNK